MDFPFHLPGSQRRLGIYAESFQVYFHNNIFSFADKLYMGTNIYDKGNFLLN